MIREVVLAPFTYFLLQFVEPPFVNWGIVLLFSVHVTHDRFPGKKGDYCATHYRMLITGIKYSHNSWMILPTIHYGAHEREIDLFFDDEELIDYERIGEARLYE